LNRFFGLTKRTKTGHEMEAMINISGTKQRRYLQDKISKPKTTQEEEGGGGGEKVEDDDDLHDNMNKLKKAYQPE